MRIVAVAETAIAVLLLFPISGARSTEWTGTISSARLAALPGKVSFDVQVYDDSFENLRFRETFLRALALAGYALARQPTLDFSFQPEFVAPVSRRAGRRLRPYARHPRRPELRPQYPISYVRVGATADTWLIGARNKWLLRKERGQRLNRPGRLHFNVQLRDVGSRSVLWAADLYCDVLISDRERIERAMIAPIIGRIGKTTRSETFTIR